MKKFPKKVLNAFAVLKEYCVEVEYIEKGSFQGGEEECFLKGASYLKTPCYVFSPDFEPFTDEDNNENSKRT